MKILRICQEVPYPPTDGIRIEPFYITKGLAELGHDITLASFQSDARDVAALKQWCKLHIVPFRCRNSFLNLAKGAVQQFPVNYIKYRSATLRSTVNQLLDSQSFDAVIVDYSALGWYALQIRSTHPSVPVITRWHNLDTLIWERWTQDQGNVFRRRLGAIQTEFVRRFETALASQSSVCVTVGAKDTDLLRRLAPDARVEFIPAGIDIEHYSPQPVAGSRNILFMASGYRWHANWDSVRWLHGEIMPLVWQKHPETVLYITGADLRPEMHKWTAEGRVVLTGFVSDERKVAAECGILVVPMRLGGGIKLKILTAFAMQKPVVATRAGAEGVAGLKDGIHCLIRDSADGFSNAVIELLADENLRERLAVNGRQLVSSTYDWRILAKHWEDLLLPLTKREHPDRANATRSSGAVCVDPVGSRENK